MERALTWFEYHGIEAKRLMTDNAWSYTHNRSLRELLAGREIKHITTKPYRPQTNGKVCVLGWGCRPVGRRGSPHLLV